MNKITAFLLLLPLFFLLWKASEAVKKSVPMKFTHNSGLIKPHISTVVMCVLSGGFFLVLAIFAAMDLNKSSQYWVIPLGRMIASIASGIWLTRFIFPWVVVSWDKDAITSRSNSWLHPFSPTQRKILWGDISKVKVRRSGAIILTGNDNQTQVSWSDSFGGHSFLTEHLRKRRPDLF